MSLKVFSHLDIDSIIFLGQTDNVTFNFFSFDGKYQEYFNIELAPLYDSLRKEEITGVEMKNLFMDIIQMSHAANTAGMFHAIASDRVPFCYYSSAILSALAMKDHGENLLIKLPGAPSWLTEPGNTLLLAIACVFPTSFELHNKEFVSHLLLFKKNGALQFPSL